VVLPSSTLKELGSSIGKPENLFYCTMDNEDGFSSNLFASIVGHTMLEFSYASMGVA